MNDDLYRHCPFRSEEPIGTVNCQCKGHPVVYQCVHPDVNYPVMLTKNRLRSRILDHGDGKWTELRTTLLKDCMTCEFRPTEAEELPPLSEQLKNFGAAVLRFAKAGMPRADRDTYQTRVETCLACPNLTGDGRCAYCGCWVAEKALWLTEICPEKRWPGETPDANDETRTVGTDEPADEGENLPELPRTE